MTNLGATHLPTCYTINTRRPIPMCLLSERYLEACRGESPLSPGSRRGVPTERFG